MHTFSWDGEEKVYPFEKPRKPNHYYVNFHHNGDYSGDVIISFGIQNPGQDPRTVEMSELKIPGEAFMEFCASAAISHIIEKLENMSPKEIMT